MKNSLFLLLLCHSSLLLAQALDSISVARELDSLVKENRSMLADGRNDEAFQVIEAALSKAEIAFGTSHPYYAKCIFNYGRTFYFANQYTEAEPRLLKADSIWAITGRENEDCARNAHLLGHMYYHQGDYDRALPFYLQSMHIREKVIGKDSEVYAEIINSLANLYHDIGLLDLAETHYIESKEIRKKVLGENSIDYANSLNNLAYLFDDMGRYEEAENLYLEAIQIFRIYGEDTDDYIRSIGNLGSLYETIGRYSEAEQFHLHVKDILERLALKESQFYANCLNNLAIVYYRMGRYERAVAYFTESKELQKTLKGPESLDYALGLNNLGAVYLITGQYAEADSVWQEALEIRGRVGKETIDYSHTLNNLGNLYWSTKQYENAEKNYLEALGIRGRMLGKDHPVYAQSLNNLAMLYQDLGRFEKVEPLLVQAIMIIENILGKEHPDYLDITNNLALFKWLSGKNKEARQHFLEVNQIGRNLVAQNSRFLAEAELSSYVNLFLKNMNELYSFAQAGEREALAGVCYDNALFYKGFVLETIGRRKNLIQTNGATASFDKEQKIILRNIAREHAKPLADRDEKQIAEWKEAAENLEKALIHQLEGQGEFLRQVSWREVQQQLAPGSAAIEFISYRYHIAHRATDSVFYSAMVLLPGESQPFFLPLFEENSLLSMLKVEGLPDDVLVEDLYGNKPALRRLVWTPLSSLLQNVSTIYYSPSGLLHFINPAALEDESGKTLSEGRKWVRLSSTRNLKISRLADKSFANKDENGRALHQRQRMALLYGGVNFDMDSLAFTAANSSMHRDDGSVKMSSYSGSQPVSETLPRIKNHRGEVFDSWEFLPGTEREVEEINAILEKTGYKSTVRKGYFASEERLKQDCSGESSPRVLLLATHGFSYTDNIQEDPMFRSGLILAGANFYWNNKRPLGQFEDGVMSAYEVRELNLRGTELAVLSACRSGLGDVIGIEGVYGLQRSFKMAGATFLVFSLWKIPDEKTSELMQLFFRYWVLDEMSLRDALTGAQKTMADKYETPFYWAGFVLVE